MLWAVESVQEHVLVEHIRDRFQLILLRTLHGSQQTRVALGESLGSREPLVARFRAVPAVPAVAEKSAESSTSKRVDEFAGC